MTKIIGLKSENVKRLHAVEIDPNGGLNVIAGRNGQGKTSVLDSIMMAFGGKSAIPSKPVRDGESKATITVKLDSGLVVTRTIKPDGSSVLKVVNGEGASFSSPQSMLDALLGSLSFDPLAFSRMKPRDQFETLRGLMGVDTTDLDTAREDAFADRTIANREIKRIDGELSGLAEHADVPAEPVSVERLVADLEAADALAREREALDAKAKRALVTADRSRDEVADAKRQIEALRAQADALKARIAKLDESIGANVAESESMIAARDAVVVPDVAPIRAAIASAESVNAKIRENARRAEVAARLADERAKSAALTERIESIDDERQARIEAAPLPMPGLALADGAVALNGIPFDQASGAEQLRASVAIGIALNPKLRVILVRDGSLLDRDGLRMLADIATERDCQVFLERVDTTDGIGIVIEGGSVVGA